MKSLQQKMVNEFKPEMAQRKEDASAMKDEIHELNSRLKSQGEQISTICAQLQEQINRPTSNRNPENKTNSRTYAEIARKNGQSETNNSRPQTEVICFADSLWKHIDKARLIQGKRSVILIVPCSTFQQVVEKAKPNEKVPAVILAVGTNHLKASDITYQIEECINHLRKIYPAPIIWICTLTPRLDVNKNYMEKINKTIIEITNKKECKIIDMWAAFTAEFPGEFLGRDKVHMNRKGTLNIVNTVRKATQANTPEEAGQSHVSLASSQPDQRRGSNYQAPNYFRYQPHTGGDQYQPHTGSDQYPDRKMEPLVNREI